MTHAEGIVLTLCSTGKRGQTPGLTHAEHFVPAPRQNFVGIALMADIPDQTVLRRVENVVDGDGQFDDPQRRPQVAAGDRNGTHGIGPQLLRQLFLLLGGKIPDIRWFPNLITGAESCFFGSRLLPLRKDTRRFLKAVKQA